MNRRTLIIAFIAAAVLLLVSMQAIAHFATDWLWFRALGFQTVFLTELGAKVVLGFGGALVAFGFFFVNLRLAQRGVVPGHLVLRTKSGVTIALTALLRRLGWGIAAFFALVMGAAASGAWLTLLQWRHRTAFGHADPVFGRDIGYYLFTLPALSAVLQFVTGLTILSLLMVVPLYALRRDIVGFRRRVTIAPSAQAHLAGLVAVLLLATAASTFFVRRPSLVYSTAGPLFGASYTDLAIRARVLPVAAVVAVIGAGLVLAGIRSRRVLRNTIVAGGAYVGVLLLGGATAAGLQKFVVTPNELVRERPQLVHHIEATRRAWGLDAVQVRDLSSEGTLSAADIAANRGTIENIRLWDRGPLLQTFQQLQEIRTYYDFRSVDDDRYHIDGDYRQVLLSARELNPASLPQRNFINERLTYTHGMGLTLSPVNQVTSEGLPRLFVQDLPPKSDVGLTVTQPRLYFGELASSYVFVNTANREFDYPLEDSTAFTVYQGRGGVRVGSRVRKLLMSIRFGSLDVLLTDLITPDSKVLFYRNIGERVARALPFLHWDSDPYLVITQAGRLVWILDGYTTSNRYPYSQPVSGGTNYMRNSVKVVLDAYDGTVNAYIVDPEDPVLRTFAKIFKGVLHPMADMPADIRAHLRFPSDLFRIQTALYSTYHMVDPNVFYAREDQWQIPNLAQGPESSDAFLRHMIMRLPGETTEEYISMTPFTPRQKDNLAAWMVARSDGDHYGELVVYRFPRQSLIFGPAQIVNRINQDTEISRQISLWDQRGSQVIRGNLLVIPIEESLLFVQALYLRAEGGQIPELKRVIVAYQNQVVMEETLDAAIARLFGGAMGAPATRPAAAAATPPGGQPGAALSPEVTRLIREATAAWEAALAAQRAGDWARYGEQMRVVGARLDRLRSLLGGN